MHILSDRERRPDTRRDTSAMERSPVFDVRQGARHTHADLSSRAPNQLHETGGRAADRVQRRAQSERRGHGRPGRARALAPRRSGDPRQSGAAPYPNSGVLVPADSRGLGVAARAPHAYTGGRPSGSDRGVGISIAIPMLCGRRASAVRRAAGSCAARRAVVQWALQRPSRRLGSRTTRW